MTRLFENAKRNWKSVFFFIFLSVLFWLLEFALQWYWLSPQQMAFSLVRSFGFSAATFLALALFLSALFKWKPLWNKYWPLRRNLGVMGTVFLLLHFWFAFSGMDFDFSFFFFSLDPFQNPLLPGLLALVLFLIVTLVSNDWLQEKLGGKNWKRIQQLVYLAFWASVVHFLSINPPMLQNPAGYLVLLVTALALFGELYWFVRMMLAKRAGKKALLVGLLLVALYLFTAFSLWFR